MTFKRRVLSALGKDELLEIDRDLELGVTTRMAVDDLRDALAKSKRASLTAIVQESLSRDTLKDICGAVGLDDTGKEKAALVERILAAGGDKAANGAGYRIDPAAVRGSKAAEGGGPLGALLSGLDAAPAKKPTKAKGKTKNGERRRGGVPESDARDREAPRLAIRIDDLPKYSEAFPFFTKEWTPGAVPKIVNVEKVSEAVADMVARLYRSVRVQHAGREKDVIRFTLPCITAMFAEDIGLLPRNYFTSLLYDGAKRKDVERRLHDCIEPPVVGS